MNDLKGKVIATAQFTEIDFFIRYLAQEAGLGIATLGSLDATPTPDRLNLVYTEDGFSSGDLFLGELKGGKGRLAGAMTWEPKTSEVLSQSGGKSHLLTSNKNLLIIADILVVNQGFAEAHPKIVEGLVRGLLEGNRLVRDTPESQLEVVAQAFKWTADQTRSELQKVHLANLPENLAFFNGSIDAAGSFGGIYQSAIYAYGSDLIKDPADPTRFTDLSALTALDKSRPLQGPDHRHRADPQRRRGQRRERPAAVQGHPLPVRAEFRDPGSRLHRESQEPRGDQAAAHRESGLDDPASRPRRQLPGGGLSQEGGRGLRQADGAQGRGTLPRSRRRDPAAAGAEARGGRQAHRNRGPWLG